jgi:hypothetical protein
MNAVLVPFRAGLRGIHAKNFRHNDDAANTV